MKRENIRSVVRGLYDIQKLRIETGNRICANFKSRLGQQPGEKEETLADDAKQLLAVLRLSYRRISDGLTDSAARVHPKRFTGDELISDYTEFTLIGQYVDLLESENRHVRNLEVVLESLPIYTGFLKPIKGIGPMMAGVIVSEIDPHKARYPSSVWKYAGLDVAADGRGRSRKEGHLIDVEYTDKDGEPKKRKGITFNPWLKTKLVGVLATSFLRSASPYRKLYDDYKHRLENHVEHAEKSKGHRHNMAIRYMIKLFLVDLHREWRELEGLPVSEPYHVAKLGHRKHEDAA